MRALFTWPGVHPGCSPSTASAAPETIGADSDVPDIHMYPGETMRAGAAAGSVAASGTGATIQRPGAEMSGFRKPSPVWPYADQGAATSSAVPSVPFVSSAPTVMTNGSLPGACVIETPPGWPKFPAAATTTTPWNQSFSTAASSGSFTKLDCASLTSERFATRMLYALWFFRIQSHAAMTSLMCEAPFASAVRTLTIGAVGTTPG